MYQIYTERSKAYKLQKMFKTNSTENTVAVTRGFAGEKCIKKSDNQKIISVHIFTPLEELEFLCQ